MSEEIGLPVRIPVRKRGLNHDRAFQTFLFQFAGERMGTEDIPRILLIIGVTAAGAIKFCPAGAAVMLIINGGVSEAVLHFQIIFPGQHIPHLPLRLPDKLMAGKHPAVGIHRRVFVAAAAAACDSLGTFCPQLK